MTTMRPRAELTPTEYEAFFEWYQKLMGAGALVPPNNANIFNIAAYKRWETGGRPGFRSLGQLSPEERERETLRWYDTGEGEGGSGDDWMSQYEKERSRLELELLRGQVSQMGKPSAAEMGLATQRQGAETARLQQLLGGAMLGPGDITKAEQFERLREQALSQLTGPDAWITRWEKMRERNPHIPAKPEEDELVEAQNWLDKSKSELKKWKRIQENPPFETTGTYPSLTEQSDIMVKSYMGHVKKYEGEVKALIESGYEPPSPKPIGPTSPPAPSWLPEFAPGQVAGKPITRETVPTPSGQQWTRTPWSVREGLGGYAEWVGKRPWVESLEQMALMQPKTPRGAGQTRWTPARQRI